MRGSPPPTRGTLALPLIVSTSAGITPAYAGNTGIKKAINVTLGDHPRLRGEHVGKADTNACTIGSPPPTRGTQ